MSANEITNPYTGEVVTRCAFLSKEEALAKLEALARAQREWAALPLSKRVEVVEAGARFFEQNADAIASDTTAAVGKPLAQSKGEVEAGVGKMRTLCGNAAAALAPEVSEGGDFRYTVRREPKGVVEIIVPWNYPIFTALNGVVPALLAGNAVALKHQSTPSVGDWFERAFGGAGAPISHLCVDIGTSDFLGANADPIAHRVFTGSVRGGRAVSAAVGERAKNESLRLPFIGTSLELGGADAAYVHGDLRGNDLAHAAEFILTIGRLHNSGQSCCATKRVVVHDDVYDDFVRLAAANCARQVCGDPLAAGTTIGPLYGGRAACDELFDVILDARDKGARVLVGGEDCTAELPLKLRRKCCFNEKAGHFFVPTLLLNAHPGMRCMREEVFGPVLAVARAPKPGGRSPSDDGSTTDDDSDDGEDDDAGGGEDGALDLAIRLMADVKYGLTASVWTLDESVADAVVDRMPVGTCFVNWCNDVHAQVVWSGLGLSGNGAGAMGHEGFRVLTNPKSVVRRAAPMKFP